MRILLGIFFSGLEKCFGREWNIFPGIFQGFYMLVKDTHFQNHLNSIFLVLQPKIAVLMNSSTLICIKIKSKVFKKNCLWLHRRFAKKLLTTLWSFLQIFCKAYVVELNLLLHRRSPSNFLKFTFSNSITTLLLYGMWNPPQIY